MSWTGRKPVVTSSLIALMVTLGPIATALTVPTLAHAQGNGQGHGNGGNSGNGGGHGNAGGQSGDHENAGDNGNGHGQVASALGGLNAAHASDQAFAHAAAESTVGQLAPYREAVGAVDDAYLDWQVAYAAYIAEQNGYSGRGSGEIQADIDALDQTSDTYDDDLAALNAELDAAVNHENDLVALATTSNEAAAVYQDAQATAQEDLSRLADAGDLSDETLAELRALLSH
ncbi:hypothetical protein [Nioella nitratireducens]|uniref:hypothetical protein n=1 Tax=Nioella nitratireducens TaxID=1287720 RepID=UPI0011BAA763|nr:hypothetical protein [Nioella nitratireducens]